MGHGEVLNPEPAPGEPRANELSAEVLVAAQGARASGECGEVERLAGRLHLLEPAELGGDAERTAFWINLYNALLLHRLCLRPMSGSVLRQLRLFDRVAYRVGGDDYSLNVIEHGLLRGNRRPPYRPRRVLRRGDPRLAASPSRPDPRVHFALNCGARSCPPISAYGPGALDDQLELATRAYLESESSVDPDRGRVVLPRLMRLYARDFGSRAERLDFASRYLPALRELLGSGGMRRPVRYGRFDWTAAGAPPDLA